MMDVRMDSPLEKIFNAAKHDDLETVRMLIESAGVSPSIENFTTRETLAQVAIKRGNLGMLKYLLEKNSSLLKTNSKDHPTGGYPLIYQPLTLLEDAVTRGHLDIVKYLVEVHNQDIFTERIISDHNRNVVDLAIEKGHLNIVRYFIEGRKVDPNTNHPSTSSWFSSGDPLLFAAVRNKQPNITTYLIEDRKVDLTVLNGKKENILFTALSNGDLDFIRNVLDVKKAKIDINWRDIEGQTLVYSTVLHNRIDILRYLVERKNADVNIPSGYQERTPLQEAIFSSNVDVFKYLVDHGTDLEKRDRDGRTALHLAVNTWRDESEFCKHLLQHGANVKSKDNDGDTPLHDAITLKDLKASKYLIDSSGNVNEKNDDGGTLLHIVAARGARKLVVYLVEKKHAQINVTRDRDHWTPLHCASVWGHREICEYLIEQGADPRAKDKMGRSPAQVASNKELMDYIQKAAEVRSRRSVDDSIWIPAQPSMSDSRTYRLTGGQHMEEIVSASAINAFHIHGALAFTDFIIRYLFPSSVHTRRIEVDDDLASNMENTPNRVVHIAENAVHAFLDFEEEEEEEEAT